MRSVGTSEEIIDEQKNHDRGCRTQDFQMELHPTWKLLEFVCEENNRWEAGHCVEADVQKKNPK